jgi:hypothetical protein
LIPDTFLTFRITNKNPLIIPPKTAEIEYGAQKILISEAMSIRSRNGREFKANEEIGTYSPQLRMRPIHLKPYYIIRIKPTGDAKFPIALTIATQKVNWARPIDAASPAQPALRPECKKNLSPSSSKVILPEMN